MIMDEKKKVRKSYKQLYDDSLKTIEILESSSKEQINIIASLESKVKKLEGTIVNSEELEEINNTIIASLESKVNELEGTISYLKPLISKKDDTRMKQKLKGVKFKNGKFVYNGKEYDKVSDIQGLNHG